MEHETYIKDLAPLAARATEVHESLASAIADETEAEALLLERVIAVVGPTALAAVATRPEIAFSIRDHAGNAQHESSQHADWRGVLLSCEPRGAGPERDNERANTGAYEGSDLLLLPDGSFRELQYSGTWSKWQGSSWSWTATARAMTVREVAAEYQLDLLLGRLRARLESVVNGNAPKRAEQARERAGRVRAILALL